MTGFNFRIEMEINSENMESFEKMDGNPSHHGIVENYEK
jgi:hypothetical protein